MLINEKWRHDKSYFAESGSSIIWAKEYEICDYSCRSDDYFTFDENGVVQLHHNKIVCPGWVDDELKGKWWIEFIPKLGLKGKSCGVDCIFPGVRLPPGIGLSRKVAGLFRHLQEAA